MPKSDKADLNRQSDLFDGFFYVTLALLAWLMHGPENLKIKARLYVV